MEVVNINEAKAHLSKYLSKVERGERVVIARRNRPIAELRLLTESEIPRKRRPMGLARGKIRSAPDAFAPLSDEALADWVEMPTHDPLLASTGPKQD